MALPSLLGKKTSELDTNAKLLEAMRLAGIEAPKPQANILQRLFTPLQAIGSVPDVIYQSAYKKKNPLTTYLGNLGQGLKTAIGGEVPEREFKTFADILERSGAIKGQDLGSKVLRGGIGFVGDVALDPLTYVTFGTAGFERKSFEKILEKAGVTGSKEFMAKTASMLAHDVPGAFKVLEKSHADKIPFIRNSLLKIKPMESMALNIPFTNIGTKLPITNQPIVRGLKALTNPLGAAGELGWAAAKKVAPEATSALSKTATELFVRGGVARKLGYEPLQDAVDMLKNKMATIEVTAPMQSELIQMSKDLDVLMKTNPDEVGKLIAALETPGSVKLSELGTGIAKNIRSVLGASQSELVGKNILSELSANPNYFPHEVLGFTKEYIQNRMPNEAGYLLGNDKVLKELQSKQGYAGLGTIKEVLGQTGMFGAPAEGARNVEKYLAGHLEQRTFPTMAEGVAAGVKYNENVGQAVLNSVIRNKQAAASYDFIKSIPDIRDIYDLPIFMNGHKLESELKGVLPEYMTKVDLGLDNVAKQKIATMTGELGEYAKKVEMTQSKLEKEVQKLNKQVEKYTNLQLAAEEEAFMSMGKAGTKNLRMAENRINKLSTAQFDLDIMRQEAQKATEEYAQKKLELDALKKSTTFYAPKEAVSVLKNYTENLTGNNAMSKVIGWYDKVLGLFKKSVTGMGPGFVSYNVRNALGDFNNMLLGGFQNRGNALQKGFDIMGFVRLAEKKGLDKVIGTEADKIIGKEVDGSVLRYSDVWKKGMEGGLITGSQTADELGMKLGATALTPGQRIEKIGQTLTGRTIAETRENSMRLANLIDNYERYKGGYDKRSYGVAEIWNDALKGARSSSLDYNNLTPFEKNVMKRVIPFYSFMRQNLEHQLRVLSESPRTFSTQQKFFTALRNMLGADVKQEDLDALPDWMKQGLSIPISNENGNVTMLTSFGEPTQALNQIIGTDIPDTLRKAIASSSPAIKIPLEQALGVNTFSNSPIVSDVNRDGTRYKDAPQAVKDFLEYREVEKKDKNGKKFIQRTVNPEKAYWLANIPVASAISTIGKRATEGGISPLGENFGEVDPWKLSQLVTGSRVYTKNIALSRTQKEREMQKKIEDELYRRGLGSTFSTFYINKSADEQAKTKKKKKVIKPLGK